MNLLHAPAGLGASLRRIMNASDPAKSTANAIKPHSVRVGTDRIAKPPVLLLVAP
jgi:hypothetical protein